MQKSDMEIFYRHFQISIVFVLKFCQYYIYILDITIGGTMGNAIGSASADGHEIVQVQNYMNNSLYDISQPEL